MHKIHYAKVDIHGDIPCYEFKTKSEVWEFVSQALNLNHSLKSKIVYLVAIQDDVFVTENTAFIEELFDMKLNSVYPFYEGDESIIQEYNSYEEAYEVALATKEENPLCYTPES